MIIIYPDVRADKRERPDVRINGNVRRRGLLPPAGHVGVIDTRLGQSLALADRAPIENLLQLQAYLGLTPS